MRFEYKTWSKGQSTKAIVWCIRRMECLCIRGWKLKLDGEKLIALKVILSTVIRYFISQKQIMLLPACFLCSLMACTI